MNYSILIVDDSATTRAMIKRTIRLAEMPVEQIHEAANGREALELLAKAHVDLILADLNMPEMNGFEMTRLARLDPKTRNIPVVIVSASPNADAFAQGQQVSGYLSKPFTPEAIRKVVSQVLEVQHARVA
ncbi:MAG: response regulator [Tepidisphaeraceae bacterium]|jgi:two-component system, chemotaxis family, chemotaxis protein CheY